MKIYDYKNNAIDLTLPQKKIKEIFVSVISRDETGMVIFEDGTNFDFDSSDSRFLNFHDGSYMVPENLVDEWMNWKPTAKSGTYSYERQKWIWERLEALKDADD